MDFQKCAIKKLKHVTRVESHASALSLLESGEERYIKAIITIIIIILRVCVCVRACVFHETLTYRFPSPSIPRSILSDSRIETTQYYHL